MFVAAGGATREIAYPTAQQPLVGGRLVPVRMGNTSRKQVANDRIALKASFEASWGLAEIDLRALEQLTRRQSAQTADGGPRGRARRQSRDALAGR